MTGPLDGLRVVELVGQGPGPYGAMLLADLGADVVAVVRPTDLPTDDRPATNPMMRGKRSVAIDLKDAEGVAAMRALLDRADAFIDPFRPGVCERLGIGPDEMLASNERLIYARMTGFRSDRPVGPRRRPRHQLHRHGRGAAHNRLRGPAADDADQPARRLRRGWAADGDGHRCRRVRTRAVRTRTGARRSDGGGSGDDPRSVLRGYCLRRRGGREEPTTSTAERPSTRCTRRPMESGWPPARSSPSSTRP